MDVNNHIISSIVDANNQKGHSTNGTENQTIVTTTTTMRATTTIRFSSKGRRGLDKRPRLTHM